MIVKKGPAFWNLDYRMLQDCQIQIITACMSSAKDESDSGKAPSKW